MSSYFILTINFGSTSTKMSIYENETQIARKGIDHPRELIESFNTILEQKDVRKQAVLDFLAEEDFAAEKLSCIVARSPALLLQSGAYNVNQVMVNFATDGGVPHAASLCCMVAHDIAQPLGIPAFTYDCELTDERLEIAKISGHPELPRYSICHYLNMHTMALRAAKDAGRAYDDMNMVMVHMGGGISAAAIENGRFVDNICDDEGAFSPERAGGVQAVPLIELCFSGKYTQAELTRMIRGKGGLVAYLGTADAREVEARIENGDAQAKLLYEAMALQVAKIAGMMATVLCGKVDMIVLTGGIAYSEYFVKMVSERIGFIAPVKLYPGENELESLAMGALRVLHGEEAARTLTENDNVLM